MLKNILNPTQIKALTAIGQSELAKIYYWTGGTALAYKYLNNRLSVDLDFFSYDLIADEELLALVNNIKKQLGVKRIKFYKNLNRQQFILDFGNKISLQLEFVYFPFDNISKPKSDQDFKIKVDSLVDMATNKTLATYQRNEPKDIFDLYSLLETKKFKLPGLIKNVNKKFEIEIDEADLEAKILSNIDLLENIRPLILNKRNFKIGKIEAFFTKKSVNYLKTVIF